MMDVDMDKEGNLVIDMVNGSVRSLVYRYLALERRMWEEDEAALLVEDEDEDEDEALLVEDEDEDEDEALLVEVEEEPEVEMEVEMELDEQDMIIPLTQTWSWVPDSGDGASVEALMEEDADARFSEGEHYGFSVQELFDDDAVERF